MLAVVVDHDPGWHTNLNKPKTPPSWAAAGFTPWPTDLTFTPPSWATARPVQWPKGHSIKADLAATGIPEPFEVYEGRVVVYIPIDIGATAPLGPAKFGAQLEYQACEEACLAPTSKAVKCEVTIVEQGTTPTKATDQADFAGFDPSVFNTVTPPTSSEPDTSASDASFFRTSVFGWDIQFGISGIGGRILLLLAPAFGGLILNLTPCVLPVIPIKIMSLQQTAKSPKRSLFLGMIMALGLVSFWMVIGAVIGTSTSFKAASQLIAVWWFTVGIGFFVGIMGVGMMGAFTINLPQWIYSVDANHESAKGSFTYGVLTAILALPCVAPFAGTAMAIASTQGPLLAVAIFSSIGVGMAIPYMVLAAKPQWVSFVPSAGPASDLLKQVMGLLMIAAAVFFVGTGTISLVSERPYLAQQLHWWVIAAILVVSAIWLVR
ncbi:MAG: cytochrome c biogenesis protein CcdA, partial [Phycisphaerales bacterium]